MEEEGRRQEGKEEKEGRRNVNHKERRVWLKEVKEVKEGQKK